MPFISLFLVAGALAITVIALVIFIGRYADRGLKLQQSDQLLTDLQNKLEQALNSQEALTQRIEHLEAIVTAEAWDALQGPSAAALALPEEPSPEEKAATLAQRVRNT